MKIEVGDRVRALDDCRMAGRGSSRYFYRAGDTGAVVRFDGLGAWVKWDNNHIDDGVWYASTEVLALIEEDMSDIDVKGVPYKQATNYADGVYGPDDLAAVWNACVNAHKALAQQPAPVASVGVEGIIEAFDEITGLCRHLRQGGPAPEDLHDLSGALDEAIGIAGDMLATLATLAQQPAACAHSWHDYGKVNRAWCSRCNAVAVIGHEDRPYGVLSVTDDGEYRTNPIQQPAAVVGVEQVASAIAIEDTGVSWHDVSPRDRTHYVKLARAALAAQKGGDA